jgi:hypothetical protein
MALGLNADVSLGNQLRVSSAFLSARPRASLLVGALILCIAGGLIGLAALTKPPQQSSLPEPLKSLLPGEISGWTTKDLPIAESAEMRRAIDELLNYDDGVLRVFERHGIIITIYVAYWRPQKMSPRLVEGHTPDVCWPSDGWQSLSQSEIQLTAADGRRLPMGRYRTFGLNAEKQYVVFWHTVDRLPVAYPSIGAPPWWAMLHDLRQFGLHHRGEQMFLRIASNVPIEEIWQAAPIQKTVVALAPFWPEPSR